MLHTATQVTTLAVDTRLIRELLDTYLHQLIILCWGAAFCLLLHTQVAGQGLL